MNKTLGMLVVVALLGIVAAATATGSQRQSAAVASTQAPSTTSTATTSTSPASSTIASSSSGSSNSVGQYKDGTYVGTTSSNYYDQIQVSVVVSGGKITHVSTPVLNGDTGRSQEINNYAVPQLTQETLDSQSASIDGISGASYTSQAYVDSLQSALDQAKA